VNCDGEAANVDIDIDMPVDEWVMFVYSELEGVGIVTFMVLEELVGLVELAVLVVHVVVPEYAVYAAASPLMDDMMLPGMLLMGRVLGCGMDDVAIGAVAPEVTPAAPHSVLAKA
jgi:hypothetical protein